MLSQPQMQRGRTRLSGSRKQHQHSVVLIEEGAFLRAEMDCLPRHSSRYPQLRTHCLKSTDKVVLSASLYSCSNSRMIDVLSRLARLDTCVVSDALDKLGLSGVAAGLSRLATARKLAGQILTVKLESANGRLAE